MPSIPFGVQTTGVDQLRKLSAQLKQQGRADLRRKLAAAVRNGGQDAVQAAREAILAKQFNTSNEVTHRTPQGTTFTKHLTFHAKETPKSTGHGGGGRKQRTTGLVGRASTERARELAKKRDSGLRATIARNIKISVTARGVKIVVPKDLIPHWYTPARDTDKDKGWRHPVFGDREVWVDQRGGPWFSQAIQGKAPAVRQALLDAMDETANKLVS